MATTERPPKRVRTEPADFARDAAAKSAPVRTPVKRVFKVALDSPFTVRWPTVEAATQERVVELLRSEFSDVGEQRLARQREISRAWLVAKRKNKGTTEAGEAAERPKQIPLPDGVVTGFNSASRLCEQGKARMLFVCRDMQPAILCQHFPLLAHHSRATLVPLTHSTAQLGALFGIPRLAVFAIRNDTPQFDSLVGAIAPLIPPAQLDWLPTHSSAEPAFQPMRYRQIPVVPSAARERPRVPGKNATSATDTQPTKAPAKQLQPPAQKASSAPKKGEATKK